METAMAILAGSIVAGGIYLLLSRSPVRMLFGLVLLSNAVNLSIFTAGGLDYRNPPLIASGDTTLSAVSANALPQALILTAIVIGFALLTFMFVLFYRSYETVVSKSKWEPHDNAAAITGGRKTDALEEEEQR